MNRLKTSLHQIEVYNEEVKNELQIAKREVEGSETDRRRLEKEKDEQDFLIVELENSWKRKTEEQALLESQLNAQISEKHAADVILRLFGWMMRIVFLGNFGRSAKRYGKRSL